MKTLLNSGNAVFTSKRATKPERIEKMVAKGIAERFGFEVSVIVRTASELAEIVEGNPIPSAESDGARFMVGFLSAKPAPATLRGIDPAAYAPEEFALIGRELYLWFRAGVLESKVSKVLTDKRLGVAMTTRNWNTLLKLRAVTTS